MRTTSSNHETSPLETTIVAKASSLHGSDLSAEGQGGGSLQGLSDPSAEQQEPLLNADITASLRQQASEDERHTQDEGVESAPCPPPLSEPSGTACRACFVDPDDYPPTLPKPAKAGPVAWSNLPKKRQLAILTIARLSEPLTQTSLQAYMFYQLRSFDPSLPDSTISSQAGMLQGSFTAAQFVTAMLWGRIADSEKVGRKVVLLIGLLGTCISCVGFGFSRSFIQAAVFRTLGGALNGNVGVMRTMISEIIQEKKFQSRAFLLLPMTFNIGVIIGPVLGGLLSDPVGSYPRIFGANSLFGGQEGVWWLKHWPYALPNLLSAVFLLSSAIGVILGLEEVRRESGVAISPPKPSHDTITNSFQTHESLRDSPDFGLRFGSTIADIFRRIFYSRTHHYTVVNEDDTLDSPTTSSRLDSYELESRLPKSPSTPNPTKPKFKTKAKLPLSRIWTRNVLCILLCHGILAFHVGTFNNLWFIHLSTPRFDPLHPSPSSHKHQRLPFAFTGGLGMPPRSVGFAMAVLGVIGISLQLLVYPKVNAKLGTTRSFRYSLCLFPLTYALVPYLSVIPSSSAAPAQASGFLVWLSITFVLLIQVLARTFALPAGAILINNCSPHPSVLGTIHGISQSVSSASRTIGPVLGGYSFGKGLQIGVVGMIWWFLAVVAACGWCVSSLVREGDGHEILLPGEEMEGGGDEEVEIKERVSGREADGDIDGRTMQGSRHGYVRE